MFVAKNFIYIQLQKTACTHIAYLMSRIFDGEQVGKHNSATSEQINSSYYFISSIRNPWDWYLSLWTFGVQGGGGLKNRLERTGNKAWHDVYSNSSDVELFRTWLKMINEPDNFCYLGEGYCDSMLQHICGFMTYRYLYLCVKDVESLKNQEVNLSFLDVSSFEKENCYIDFFIRQEELEKSFLMVMQKIDKLSLEQKKIILGAKKNNISHRVFPLEVYYDHDSVAIVAEKEKLIIEKFGYAPPVLV